MEVKTLYERRTYTIRIIWNHEPKRLAHYLLRQMIKENGETHRNIYNFYSIPRQLCFVGWNEFYSFSCIYEGKMKRHFVWFKKKKTFSLPFVLLLLFFNTCNWVMDKSFVYLCVLYLLHSVICVCIYISICHLPCFMLQLRSMLILRVCSLVFFSFSSLFFRSFFCLRIHIILICKR